MVANSDDVGELAATMTKGADAARHARLKSAAEARRGDYSLDKMVEETERVYESLAGNS
jgi:hypothetical protein